MHNPSTKVLSCKGLACFVVTLLLACVLLLLQGAHAAVLGVHGGVSDSSLGVYYSSEDNTASSRTYIAGYEDYLDKVSTGYLKIASQSSDSPATSAWFYSLSAGVSLISFIADDDKDRGYLLANPSAKRVQGLEGYGFDFALRFGYQMLTQKPTAIVAWASVAPAFLYFGDVDYYGRVGVSIEHALSPFLSLHAGVQSGIVFFDEASLFHGEFEEHHRVFEGLVLGIKTRF